MSIKLLENFASAENLVVYGDYNATGQAIDSPLFANKKFTFTRWKSHSGYNGTKGRLSIERVTHTRDEVEVNRPAAFLCGSNSAIVNGYGFSSNIWLNLKDFAEEGKVWVGARVIQKVPGGELSGTTFSRRFSSLLYNSLHIAAPGHSVLNMVSIDEQNIFRFGLPAQHSGVNVVGYEVLPKNTPGEPFFLDIEFDLDTGVARAWIDNFFVGEQTYDTSYHYLSLGMAHIANRWKSAFNGVYITDLMVSVNDDEGWCNRFGPDFWVEEWLAETDVTNQWARSSTDYDSNHAVVAKSAYDFINTDTAGGGNQDFLDADQSGLTDTYKYTGFSRDKIIGVATDFAVVNTASSLHTIASAVQDGITIKTGEGQNIPYSAGVVCVQETLLKNPTTGEDFDVDEIARLSFGFQAVK